MDRLDAALRRFVPVPIRRFFDVRFGGIERFAFGEGQGVREDIERKYGICGDLLELYAGGQGHVIHKWHHYIPIYERYLSRFRGRPVRFLEIGVSQGGSLQMWRSYFGRDAVIYGIDIDPRCQEHDGVAGRVRIGSQGDHAFLTSVVREMGGLDIVLDDGSHRMGHIRSSLTSLFPRLEHGGIYMIEDLHTAYWRSFGGGYRAKANFFNFTTELIHDMHRWYHQKGMRHAAISEHCTGVHVHDSITVLEKGHVYPPTHSQVGRRGEG